LYVLLVEEQPRVVVGAQRDGLARALHVAHERRDLVGEVEVVAAALVAQQPVVDGEEGVVGVGVSRRWRCGRVAG
jgi:hypothetical protein